MMFQMSDLQDVTMRTALYARVSTTDQSVEMQRAYMKAY